LSDHNADYINILATFVGLKLKRKNVYINRIDLRILITIICKKKVIYLRGDGIKTYLKRIRACDDPVLEGTF
jgi:hypothetical protein